MRISFTPVRGSDRLSASISGDVVTINGEQFDFTSLPDGGTIPPGSVPCKWIVGPVERIGGELNLTLVLPHGSNPGPAVAFPSPIMVTADGAIQLPEDSHVDA